MVFINTEWVFVLPGGGAVAPTMNGAFAWDGELLTWLRQPLSFEGFASTTHIKNNAKKA